MAHIGPELPPHLARSSAIHDDDSDEEGPQPASVPSIGPSIPTSVGPQIPTLVDENKNSPEQEDAKDGQDEDDDEDDYAPALPPDLIASRSTESKRIIGPSLPGKPGYNAYESDDDEVGPMPAPAGANSQYESQDAVKEFMEREERRRKQAEEAAKPKKLQREEWMLVPPSSSDLMSSLDPTRLHKSLPRQFSRNDSASTRDKSTSSLWTETPAERQQRIADEVAGKKRRAVNAAPVEDDEETRRKRKRDAEIRRGVEEHTKKTRGASLVDIHDSATAEKRAKDDEDDKPAAIWDHARDMSVGGKLMDEKQRSKMINDAKALGDRFGTGKSGGFL